MEPEYYVFTGRDGEEVPDHVTHVLIAKARKFVPARALWCHPNIQEVICHDGVLKVEEEAFKCCPSLRRVIMPGVKEVEQYAFSYCKALVYIQCGKMERIGMRAFDSCTSLSSVDLPSIKIVEGSAFACCKNLIKAKFSKDLEAIWSGAFFNCTSLELIALPLKDDMITHGSVVQAGQFQRCEKLTHIDLVGGVHETVDALLLEEWKNDMNEEINAVNQILPNTSAGNEFFDKGEYAVAIRSWITSVLQKIIHYKAEHRRILNDAAATLQSSLPNDIVLKNVLPFLELPPYTFQGENSD